MGIYLKVNKEKLATAIANAETYITNLTNFKNNVTTFLDGCTLTQKQVIHVEWQDKYENGQPVYKPGSTTEIEQEVDSSKTYDYSGNQATLNAAKALCNTEAGKIETDVIKPIQDIKAALEAVQALVEAFDGKSASLKEFLEGYDENGEKAGEDGTFYIETITNEDGTTSEQLKFKWTDSDGNTYELTIAEMVNSFYTEVGTTLDSMIMAAMYAEQNGLDPNLTKEQMEAVLNGVNSFIGAAQAAHAFGVASMADIQGVIDDNPGVTFYSPEEISKAIGGYDDLAGVITKMGALGGLGAMSAYTLTDMLDKFGKKVDPPASETPSTTPDPTNPNPTDPYTPSGPSGPSSPSNPTPDPSASEEPSSEPLPTLLDITPGELPEPIKLEPEADDIDQMARDAFEEQFENEEAYAEYQAKLIEQFDQLFSEEGQAALREKLKSYGYNDIEIDGILANQDLARNAFLAGEQSLALTELANKIAQEQGIENFDTGFDLEGDNTIDFDAGGLTDGSINQFLTNTNLDPTVNAAKTEYTTAKAEYDKLAAEANETIKTAQTAKTTLDEYVKNLDSDKTKWTKEQAEKYNELAKDYNDKYEKAKTAKDGLDESKKSVDEKKEAYDKAKQEYLDKIKEENKPDPDTGEDPENPVDPENPDGDGGVTDEDLLDSLHYGDDGSVTL